MICNSYTQVYKYYLFVANIFKDKSIRILKTDTHNESNIFNISIPLAPILADGNDLTCIEIDPEVLNLAKKNFPNIRMLEGDIRKLNRNEKYDLILDFSTIDHIQPSEYKEVLKSYREMSKNISIIVWLSNTRPNEEKQYFFNNLNFRNDFREIFGDFKEVLLFTDYGASLVHFFTFNDKNTEALILKSSSDLIERNKEEIASELNDVINAEKNILLAEFEKEKLLIHFEKVRMRILLFQIIKRILPYNIFRGLKNIKDHIIFLSMFVYDRDRFYYIKKYSNIDANPWCYMDKLNYRFEITKKNINFRGLNVVELNSGNTGLYELVKKDISSYRANNLRKSHPIVEIMSDIHFVKKINKCDILCCFGHAGYQDGTERLESTQINKSILYLIEKFKPKNVVLECITKYKSAIYDIYNAYSHLYTKIDFKHEGDDWLNNRILLIMTLKNFK